MKNDSVLPLVSLKNFNSSLKFGMFKTPASLHNLFVLAKKASNYEVQVNTRNKKC